MRVLLQKVSQAAVSVDGSAVGSIDHGYLLFLGVMRNDQDAEARWLAEKIVKLRLFDSEDGTLNDRSILDTGGEILVVSQFTLAGNVEKGNRPDYTGAENPQMAEKLYAFFIEHLRSLGVSKVQSGKFGAFMTVSLVNEGPVTLCIDRSPKTVS